MTYPRLPSWPTTLTTLAVLIIHALVLWLLSDLLFNRPPDETITPGPYLISALILSTLLLPLLILALRGRRPRGQRHCPRCWYTLDPALGLKCSECGHEATSDRQTRKPRRRYKLAAATLCLIALCQLTWLETRISRGGWLAAVPTEALIIGMPWVPEYALTGDLHQPRPLWLLGTDKRADWSLSGWARNPTEFQWQWAMERATNRVITAESQVQWSEDYSLAMRLKIGREIRRELHTTIPWRASVHVILHELRQPTGSISQSLGWAVSALDEAVNSDPSLTPVIGDTLAPCESVAVALLFDNASGGWLNDAAYGVLFHLNLTPESLRLLEQHLTDFRVARLYVAVARRNEAVVDRIAARLRDSSDPSREQLAAILSAPLWRSTSSPVLPIAELDLSEQTLRNLVLLLAGPPSEAHRGLPAAFEVVSRRPELSIALEPVMIAAPLSLAGFVPEALRLCESEHEELRALGTILLRRLVHAPGFPESQYASEALACMHTATAGRSMDDDTRRRIARLASGLEERIPQHIDPE